MHYYTQSGAFLTEKWPPTCSFAGLENTVNTSVFSSSSPKQCPKTIQLTRVFEAFGGFKIAQTYGIYMVLCTFPAENDGIYTVLCAFPAHNRGAPLDRRRQNTVNTSVFSPSCLQAWPQTIQFTGFYVAARQKNLVRTDGF